MAKLLDALAERVLLCDGGTGSRVQAMDLEVDRDYWGQENCTEVLNLSRPDIVREIHRGYLEAGSDIVQTNSFGGSPITLAEFDGLSDRAHEINRLAGELAREAIEMFGKGKERFVLGSIGPGTKLPSLGHIGYDRLEEALAVQARGTDRGQRRRHPDRDLPGHAADQGRGQRRQDRPAPKPGQTLRSSSRSRSRPPARCWSGRISRRRRR